jgi:hypothetical protein
VGRSGRMQQPTKAYLLVQTERWGTTVADRLREISGVVLAEDVSGPYDALALISCADESDGLPRILDAVRDVPGVLRVLAAPLLASEDPGARVDAA